MDSLFHHVNDTALARPNVTAVVDDARSALQLGRERYDVIVSEPSNPWLAGVATLYTPEFFQIVRGRLADDGVFCQWVQLYQLPLPIVAGIVRNIRAVFPNVHVWLGESHDLLVLASPKPLTYDRAWIGRLVGPQGALRDVGREWLNVDEVHDYFGRLLLADTGVTLLVERARFQHSDDRPRLEFVAARSFLAEDIPGVFDSLMTIASVRSGAASPFLLVRTLTNRRTDPAMLRYLAAVRKAQPDEPDWVVRTAAVRFAMGDTTRADSLLESALARGPRGDALLLRGVIATGRKSRDARRFLTAALAAGGDTAQARTALALLAARDSQWVEAATQVRGALAAARGTFRHPFPAQFLAQTLTDLAFDGPPALADSVLQYAIARRPGAARYRELRSVAALRAGRCDDAADVFVELMDFGIEQEGAPALVRECRTRGTVGGGRGGRR